MIIEGCDDCSSERSICVGGGQIETTFENTYKTELRQRCTNIVMNAGPETFRPTISSVVHSRYNNLNKLLALFRMLNHDCDIHSKLQKNHDSKF